MPSDKHNSIMAKATGLIFSLFNVASAGQVPFGIYRSMDNAFSMDLPVSSFVPFIFADSERCQFGGST